MGTDTDTYPHGSIAIRPLNFLYVVDKQTKPKWTVKQKRVLDLFGVDFGQTLSDDGEFND